MSSAILTPVARYYAERLQEHGPVARGADWNGEVSQQLRFTQLLKLVQVAGSINDLGCGYGGLLGELDARWPEAPYAGFDISAEMVQQATELHNKRPNTRFLVAERPDAPADYGLASGIFNVKLASSDDDWWKQMTATLDVLHETSRVGFAFNCLTSYSDRPLMRPHLYYANPCQLFDHCKRRYSRQVALLHDYGLYEFTMLVRNDGGQR